MLRIPAVIVTNTLSPEAYARQQRQFLARAGAVPYEEPAPARASISDGRWIADCVCGAASLVHPDYAVARCGECGAIQALVFPEHRQQIEAILLMREATGARHWRGEALEEIS